MERRQKRRKGGKWEYLKEAGKSRRLKKKERKGKENEMKKDNEIKSERIGFKEWKIFKKNTEAAIQQVTIYTNILPTVYWRNTSFGLQICL